MPSDDHNGFYAYNSQLDAFVLYHLAQEDTEQDEQAQSVAGPMLPALGHAIAGAIAAALAKSSVYPIETIVTRQQVQRQLKGDKEAPSAASSADAEYTSLLDAARKIYKNEGGVKGFYPGLGADVTKGVIDTFLFFFAYNALRTYQAKRDQVKHLSVAKELGVGVLAGMFSKAITTPIQNIVTRQQTAALLAARDPSASLTPEMSDQLTVKDIALQIRSEKGLSGFWAGYSASAILTLNPAVTFAAEGFLRRLLPRSQRESPSPATTFLLAACSKVLATSLTYPVMLAKSRAQASSSKSDAPDPLKKKPLAALLRTYVRLFQSLQRIYGQEGTAGLYAGLQGELLKAFVQHGLTMTIKERVHGGVVAVYLALLKVVGTQEGKP